MIEITPTISLDENEIQLDFVRSAGPGGQNVNKVATAVQLRFDVLHSPSLPEETRTRLARLGGKRMTAEGVLVIEAKRFRTQEKNREDAVQRLVGLVQKALYKPAARRPSQLNRVGKEARLEGKKKRGEIKKNRRTDVKDWD